MVDRRELGGGITAWALAQLVAGGALAAEDAPTLREAARKRGIEIGAFASLDQIQDLDFARMISKNFTLAANLFDEMQWNANPGFVSEPDFSRLSAFLHLCETLGLRPRGRQVYSKEAMPSDAHLREDGTPKSKSELEKTLLKRVEQCCRPLRGRNAIIQVIDEILADHEGGLRKDPFSNALGEQYVDLLFHAAHEAAPDALLIYQEYGPEIRPQDYFRRKSRDYLALLERLRKRNVPITGAALGGFMHPELTLRVPFFKSIENLDYDIHFTELTQIYMMRGEPASDSWIPKNKEENDRIVALRYTKAFQFLCQLKRLREITFFAPVDNFNTVETGTLGIAAFKGARPGIFNRDMTPKPVYKPIVRTVMASQPKI